MGDQEESITETLALGYRCECRVLDLADVPRALINRGTRCAIKLLAEAETGKILGVHALAGGAGDILLATTYAIKASMTVDDLANTWAPYLTMAESLRLVAGHFGNQMPISCCTGDPQPVVRLPGRLRSAPSRHRRGWCVGPREGR